MSVDSVDSFDRGASSALDHLVEGIKKIEGKGYDVTTEPVVTSVNDDDLSNYAQLAFHVNIKKVEIGQVIVDVSALGARATSRSTANEVLERIEAIIKYHQNYNQVMKSMGL